MESHLDFKEEAMLQVILQVLFILVVSFIQNISFTMVSRARNRSSVRYHLVTAIFSNSLYLVTLSILVLSKMSLPLLIGYVIGTVTGSIIGVRISMWIERLLNAQSDAHLGPKPLSASERSEAFRDFLRLTSDEEKRQWLAELQPNPLTAR